jgi:hypothetical protein
MTLNQDNEDQYLHQLVHEFDSKYGKPSKLAKGYSSTKNFLRNKKDAFIDLLKHTTAEVYLGVTLGVIIGGTASIIHESNENRYFKLSFSETSQIEKQAKELGVDVPHMTEFLTKTNDFYMKIFEAKNESEGYLPLSDRIEPFAEALERRIDPAFKTHHYELPQLEILVPQFADSVLADMNYLRKLQKKTQSAVLNLAKAWSDYHNDVTHTEVSYTTETSTDADGNTTTQTVAHYDEVYDYTDNSYTYNNKSGENASIILDGIKKEFPKIYVENLFMTTKKTGVENESAIVKSRKSELKDKKLTQEDFLKLANNSIYGSRQFEDVKNLEKLRGELVSDGDAWHVQIKDAKSYSQRTYDYSHAESPGFLTCESAITVGNNLSDIVDGTLGSIESTKNRVPKIMNMIRSYIEKYPSKENSREVHRLKREILSESKKGYYELFDAGAPLESANWWHVPLWILLGGALGAGAGAGLNLLGDKTNIYGKKESSNKDNY